MYQVLKNGKVIINAQDLQTAVVFLRSLESNIDRNSMHSPYTIGLAPQETPDQARARNKQRIRAQLDGVRSQVNRLHDVIAG
jgi:hypothetical protein